MRLEDVAAITTPNTLNQLSSYLNTQVVPFSIAVIPWYRDPLGHYNGGVAHSIHFTDPGAAALGASLATAISLGGKIVMHGYTHQWEAMPNPYHGVSAEDFEFWNIVAMQPTGDPILGDSAAWASARLISGLAELSTPNNGLFTPYAWEVPHYHASAVDYCAFADHPLFNKTYQRAVYYTSSLGPCTNPDLAGGDLWAGQFFPYVIERDYYGQRILPENLGNIEYIVPSDPTSNVVYTADDS